MSAAPVSLVASGFAVLTPLGHDVHQTCASIRAGINGLGEHPFFEVESPEPEWDEPERLRAGLVPGIHPNLQGPRRLLELGLNALRSLTTDAKLLRAEMSGTALLLSLPEADEVVRSWDLGLAFGEELARRAGLRPFSLTFVDQSGHTSMIRMLRQASELLESSAAERCILLGVDSYHHEGRLAALDRGYRLRSDRCKDGFLPGEAAVAVLIERAGASARTPMLALRAPGFGVEPRTIRGELSSSGNGLCEAIEGAHGAAGGSTRWVYCDLNGESYRAFEWGIAQSRLATRCFASPIRLHHPADCLGDVGVASAGLAMACAAQAFERGYAPAEQALVWASADEGVRAAVVVSAPGSGDTAARIQ